MHVYSQWKSNWIELLCELKSQIENGIELNFCFELILFLQFVFFEKCHSQLFIFNQNKKQRVKCWELTCLFGITYEFRKEYRVSWLSLQIFMLFTLSSPKNKSFFRGDTFGPKIQSGVTHSAELSYLQVIERVAYTYVWFVTFSNQRYFAVII